MLDRYNENEELGILIVRKYPEWKLRYMLLLRNKRCTKQQGLQYIAEVFRKEVKTDKNNNNQETQQEDNKPFY